MFRKILALLMCMLLVIGVMAGCQKAETQKNTSNVSTSSGNDEKKESSLEDAKSDEPVKLVYFTSVNVDTEGHDVNDNPYINYIREKTGIDIEIMSEGTGYQEKRIGLKTLE